MSNLVQAIYEANPDRNENNLARRIIKLGEEYGEVSEAFLNVTSLHNGKGKSWDDVREELADLLIVGLDVALTPLEGSPPLMEALIERLPSAEVETHDSLENLMLQLMDLLGLLGRAWLDHDRNLIQYRMMQFVLCACDAARAKLPDQIALTQTEIDENLLAEVHRKLSKWRNNRSTMKTVVDDV